MSLKNPTTPASNHSVTARLGTSNNRIPKTVNVMTPENIIQWSLAVATTVSPCTKLLSM